MFSKDEIFIRKYKVEDLLYKTYQMVKKIWKEIIKTSLLFTIPISVIFGTAFGLFMTFYFDFFMKIVNYNTEKVFSDNGIMIMIFFGIFYLLSLIYAFISILGYSAICLKTYKKAHNIDLDIKEAVKNIWNNKYKKLLLTLLVMFCIAAGSTFILITIMGLFISLFIFLHTITGITAFVGITIFLGIIFYIGLMAFIIWISYSIMFAYHEIIIENKSIIDSIKRSFYLAKKNILRLFGISYLFQLIVSTIASVVITPLSFLLIFPIIGIIFKIAMEQSTGSAFFIMPIVTILFIIIFSLMMLVSMTIYYMVYPIFNTLFYIDLRVRKGEIKSQVPEEGLKIENAAT